MSDANPKSIPLTQEEARDLLFALRYEARKAVEAHWKAEGLKPQYIERRELRIASEQWLMDHWQELLPAAQELFAFIKTNEKKRKAARSKASTAQNSCTKVEA